MNPDPAFDRYRGTRFFDSLDGLRALSILGVIWFHTWHGTPHRATLEQLPVVGMGWFGVDVFFAISGYLITTLLLREQDREGSISIWNFYVRRILRIFPAYYAILALYVLLVFFMERNTSRGQIFWHYLPGYLTYTYTWMGPYGEEGPIFHFAWSLATEEQFYLVWPFVVCFLPRRWAAAVMACVLGISLTARYGYSDAAAGETLLRILQSIAPPICLGALLAFTLHVPHGFRLAFTILGRKWAAPLSLLALALALAVTGPSDQNRQLLPWLVLPFLVGACVIREDNGLARFLRFPLLVQIGVLSYGMYLLNTLAIKVLKMVLGRLGLDYGVVMLPAAIALTMAMAWVSYRYYESYFLSLKKRFERQRPQVTPPAIRLDGSAEANAMPRLVEVVDQPVGTATGTRLDTKQ